MKIIYDYKIFLNQKIGGPSRYFVELIKELIKINNNITVYSPAYINEYLKLLDKKYVKGTFFKNKNYLGKLLKIYNDISSKIFFSKKNFDILHTTYYDNVNFTNKPTIITVYDLIHEIYPNEFNFNSLPKQEVFKKIDHFICISKNTQKDLIKYYGIEEKKTSVIYLSSFNKQNSTIKKHLNIKPYFLYVGSRKRYKNFILLVKAFCAIKDISQNFDIICFGGGKFIKEEYELFNKLGVNLNSIIQLNGNDESLLKLYKGATAYICTSKYEGFGLPILEAMSCGCPVISSNSSSLPEVYGDAALPFMSDSLEDLINCIEKITMNNSLKNELINKGFKQSNQFSWKKCAKETSLVYKKLIL